MGNGICTSSANYSQREEGRPIRNTDRSTNHAIQEFKEIDKWNVDDVYQWLSTVYDGELIHLAKQFRTSRIRGRVLDNVTDTQLNEMNVEIGDRLAFNQARQELFAKYNYTPNHPSLNPSNSNSQHGQQSYAPSAGQHSHHSHHSNSRDGNLPSSHSNNQQQPQRIQPPALQIASPTHPHSTHPRNPSIASSIHRRGSSHSQQPPLPQQPYISYQKSLPTPSARNTQHQQQQGPHTRPTIEAAVGRHSVPSNVIQNRSSSSCSFGAEDIPKGPIFAGSLDEELTENQYQAVDGALLEGFEQKPGAMTPGATAGATDTANSANIGGGGPGGYHKKPTLHKSISADDCKKASHTKYMTKRGGKINSFSNPIMASSAMSATTTSSGKKQRVTLKSTKSNIVDGKFMLKIADLLQHTMQKELKTAKEILEILQTVNIENKDENYRTIFKQLIKSKLLIKKPKCTESNKTESDSKPSEIDYYQFNHSLYKQSILSSPSPSQTAGNNDNDDNNNNMNNNNGLHTRANGKYCNGVEVVVFSPKSHKWRDGLVLEYNQDTKIGKICCYTPMGKQSVKELSLPNPYVKPKMDNMSDNLPTMTASIHARPAPLQHHPSHPVNPSHQPQYVRPPNNLSSANSLHSFGSSPPMTVDGWNNTYSNYTDSYH